MAFLLHLGMRSLPAEWRVFLKALAFCCMMGVILRLAFEGVRDIGRLGGMFLEVLGLALLLKLLLALLMWEGDDSVLQRSLRVLNFVLFCCIWRCVLVFFAAGTEHFGWSWIWFSNESVVIGISAFLSPFLYQAAHCARVMGKAFLESVRLMGRSR